MLTDSKIHYRRNFLISIILSETLIISAFIFSPKKFLPDENILSDEQFILFAETPQTVQSLQVQNQRPEIPAIYISEEVESFEVLEDVNLSSKMSDKKDIISAKFSDQDNIGLIRSVPRLIFEVVPAVGKNEFAGKLQLSLKINENGEVVDHRIIFNSLDCTDCLNDIIKAAYRSKWEPAMVNGTNTDFWVVKSYIFN